MDKHSRSQIPKAFRDYSDQISFLWKLFELGFITGFDQALLGKSAVFDQDFDRTGEILTQIRDHARTELHGIDLDSLRKAFDGHPESISEISRWLIPEAQRGKSQLVGPGRVMPLRKINALATELLRACYERGRPPPMELVKLFIVQFGIDASSKQQQSGKKFQALMILAEDPAISLRELADRVGVSHTQIASWKRDFDFRSELEEIRSTKSWLPPIKFIYDDE